MSAEEVIVGLIKNHIECLPLGHRIFAVHIPEHEYPLPWAMYAFTSTEPIDGLEGQGELSVYSEVAIDVLDLTYAGAKELAMGLFRAIHGKRSGAVTRALWKATKQEVVDEGHHAEITFGVWHTFSTITPTTFSISGNLYDPTGKQEASDLYDLILNGPVNRVLQPGQQAVNPYVFSDLPAGTYTLSCFSGGPVLTSPLNRIIAVGPNARMQHFNAPV